MGWQVPSQMKNLSETKRRKKPARRRPIIKAGEHAHAALIAASRTPPLEHWVGRERGEPFDQARSQLLEFLSGHPDIRLWLFRCFYRSGAIVYNAATRKWHGKAVQP